MRASLEFLKQTLLDNDLHPSFQRIKVLDYLYRAEGHPNVDEIFQELSGEIPSLSKTTVYNTLHAFTKAGLVRAVDIANHEARFDVNPHPHGHFLCTSCGSITNFAIDIDAVPFDGLNHFEIREKNVSFYGLCPHCTQQPNPKEE